MANIQWPAQYASKSDFDAKVAELNTAITGEVSAREAAVSAEETARKEADATLTTATETNAANITAEETARKDADAALKTELEAKIAASAGCTYAVPFQSNVISTNNNKDLVIDGTAYYYVALYQKTFNFTGTFTNDTGSTDGVIYYVLSGVTSESIEGATIAAKLESALTVDDTVLAIVQ